MLHNNNTCGKKKTIEKNKLFPKIHISYAYEWNTNSDNIALINELIKKLIDEIKARLPFLEMYFHILSGKDGNIYCDICRQIQESDIVICDVSKNNTVLNQTELLYERN